MRRTLILPALAASAFSLAMLLGPAAYAKGGQDNFERQARLQAELAKQQKAGHSTTTPSLFQRLFGTPPTQSAEAPDKKPGATKTSTNSRLASQKQNAPIHHDAQNRSNAGRSFGAATSPSTHRRSREYLIDPRNIRTAFSGSRFASSDRRRTRRA